MNSYKSEITTQYEENKSKIKSLIENVDEENFNKRPAAGKWSAAECIEHLVIAGELYLEKLNGLKIENTDVESQPEEYQPRKAAEKIIRLMEPPVKLKVKAPSKFKPHSRHGKNELLKKYSFTQSKLIEKMNQLNSEQLKEKITSPASSLVKLQAGEAFLLIAIHDRRHIWQMENTLKLVT